MSDNLVSNTISMFLLKRDYGLRLEDNYVYFEDNVFRNNKFLNPREDLSSSFDMQNFYGLSTLNERRITSADVIVGNNKFSNNDFGLLLQAPIFLPESMIIDGGGNICSSSDDKNYPLKCNFVSLAPTEETGPIEIPKTISTDKDEEAKIFCNGCSLDTKCYPSGYRKSGDYCDIKDNQFAPQFGGNSVCTNNFECTSNVCISGQCISQNLIQKILNWLKNLFS